MSIGVSSQEIQLLRFKKNIFKLSVLLYIHFSTPMHRIFKSKFQIPKQTIVQLVSFDLKIKVHATHCQSFQVLYLCKNPTIMIM